jgi:hypothetical protein
METKTEKPQGFIRTTIDLPEDLNRKLLASTEKSKRSRHAEMIFILEKSFETLVGNGKKEKSK